MTNLLIIDDEQSICSSLRFAFEDKYSVFTAKNLMEVEEIINKVEFDIVLLDLKFGEISGLDILEIIKDIQKNPIVIIMTAYGSIETTIQAIKGGAYYYVTKPLNMQELEILLDKALEYKALNEKVNYLENEIEGKYGKNGIIGKSKKMKDIFLLIDKIKDLNVNVLISGESGTGKELIAKAIHYQGNRRKNRFEAINCGAIPSNLIESELFGHEKGAFTGASHTKKGRFELANGGTVFLDEIGELDPSLQVKILRVIQEREIYPLGGQRGKKIDVRIIAATNKDLKKQVEIGNFREDLFFRLNVVSIQLPTLAERKEDIPLLIEYFIKKYNAQMGKSIKGITMEALQFLEGYNYPGNVRELENIIERALALTDNEFLTIQDIPQEAKKTFNHISLYNSNIIPIKIGESLKDIEKRVILETLKIMDNNRRKTADILGISERSLRYKIKEYTEN